MPSGRKTGNFVKSCTTWCEKQAQADYTLMVYMTVSQILFKHPK